MEYYVPMLLLILNVCAFPLLSEEEVFQYPFVNCHHPIMILYEYLFSLEIFGSIAEKMGYFVLVLVNRC